MPYTTISTVKFPSADTLKFKEWLVNADPVLLNGFPETAGKTPLQAVLDEEATRRTAAGLISQTTTTPSPTSIIYIYEWVDSASFLAAAAAPTSGNVPMLDANGQPMLNPQGQPKFYTPRRYLWKIYCDEFGVTETTTKE